MNGTFNGIRLRKITSRKTYTTEPGTVLDSFRVMGVQVAVAHVGSIHEDGVVEQRALAVRRSCHFGEELRDFFHMPGFDFHQLFDFHRIVGMERKRMEGIRTPR